MIKGVFFDLDGTLVPMDLDVFTKEYLTELCKVLCPNGVDDKTLVKSMLVGMKAMRANDGKRTNKEVFWEKFTEVTGEEAEKFIKYSDPFYTNEFNNTRWCTGKNDLAKLAVELAHENGRKVVLATNPFFPVTAQVTRANWVGVDGEQFDLITSYETEVYCKPNPQYYLSICERLGFLPEECLMIGNDENDDIIPATKAGLNCFLVTDCLIPCEGYESTCPSGSFEDLIEYLKNLT